MFDKLRVGGVALVGILREHAVDHVSRFAGNVRGEGLEAHRLAHELLESDRGGGFRVVRGASGQRVEKSSAKAVDIAAKVLRLTVKFLRRDVIGRSPEFAA